MNFNLTPEQKQLQSTVVHFAQQELNEGVIGRDREQEFSNELWEKCAAMGLAGLCIPIRYGGSGYDAINTAIAVEALGYGCEDGGLSFAVIAQLTACAIPIALNGNHEQKQMWLPGLCNGSIIAANAMTETESGSDVASIATSATLNGDQYLITGTKTFASNAPVASIAVLYTNTASDKGMMGGLSAFVVDKDTHFTCEQHFEKMGLRTCTIGDVVVNQVLVPAIRLIGKEGAGGAIFNESMEWERVCMAALHVGTMRRIIERTIQYVKHREVGGKPISSYQAIAFKIADMHTNMERSWLLVLRAASVIGKSRQAGKYASMAKLTSSECLQETAKTCIQVHGGNGYMTEYGLERVLRDAVSATIYSGTSEIQRNIIAAWL